MSARHSDGAVVSAGSNWGDYRVRVWAFWLALASGVLLAVAFTESALALRLGSWVTGGVWLAWTALAAWTGTRLQGFQCPRCANRFFKRRPWLLALRSRRCARCMLPRGG